MLWNICGKEVLVMQVEFHLWEILPQMRLGLRKSNRIGFEAIGNTVDQPARLKLG